MQLASVSKLVACVSCTQRSVNSLTTKWKQIKQSNSTKEWPVTLVWLKAKCPSASANCITEVFVPIPIHNVGIPGFWTVNVLFQAFLTAVEAGASWRCPDEARGDEFDWQVPQSAACLVIWSSGLVPEAIEPHRALLRREEIGAS